MSFIKWSGILLILTFTIILLKISYETIEMKHNTIKIVSCNITDYNIYTTTCNNNIQYGIPSYNKFNYNVLCHNLVLKCEYRNNTCLIHQDTYYNYDDALAYYNNVTHEIRKVYWFNNNNCGNNIPNETNINILIYGCGTIGGLGIFISLIGLISMCKKSNNETKYNIYKNKKIY
jgi:hypothetical protein